MMLTKTLFVSTGSRSVGAYRRSGFAARSAAFRFYHSYPEPGDTVKMSTHISDKSKMGKKEAESFELKSSFKMDTVFPGTPVSTGISKEDAPKVQTSTLANGLKVATQELPGALMATIGFIVKSGSAYEQQSGPASNIGATHFLEMNAFRSNAKRPHDEIVKKMEQIGAVSQCIALKDNVFYCIDVLKENVEEAVSILAETILMPTFPDEELQESREIAQFQALELPSEVFSRDLVQRAAYGGTPLGNHHYCPLDKVESVTRERLQAFRAKTYFGSNCVLTCVGVDHDTFVKLATDKFQNLPKGTAEPRIPSSYKGGLQVEERELKEPQFVKATMAFEVGGWNSPDLVTMCVMQQLLGGGSSFSAGGPGKGMYTRLYTTVLNRNHWVEAVEAFTAVNEECGLLGIDTSCSVEYVGNALLMVVQQFTTLSRDAVTAEELSRAKNMLKSMMMMNLESRIMLCEDICRQLSTYGARKTPESLCAEIDKVTADDLKRVASKMLTRPPSISFVGEGLAGKVPQYNDVLRFVEQYKQTYR